MSMPFQVIEDRFMKVCNKPYFQFCCGCTLKTGTIVIAVVDIIIGFLSGIDFFGLLFQVFDGFYFESWMLFDFSVDLLFMIGFFFSIVSIYGIQQLNLKCVKIYSSFKAVQLVLYAISRLIIVTIVTVDLPDHTFWRLVFIIVLVGQLLWYVYGAQIVWSTSKRLEFDDITIVVHGLELALTLQRQRDMPNMEALAMPGQPIYMAPVGFES